MQKHIYIYIFLFLSHFAQAQNASHLNFWTKGVISLPIKEKIKIETELLYRRQNDYTLQSTNFFQEKLLSGLAFWGYYQHTKNMVFSASPFAYYCQNSLILREEDKQKVQVKEIRFSAAVELKSEVSKKLFLIDRTCLEYRDFQNTNPKIVRVRNRLGLRYELNNQWNVVAFDEILLNLKGASPAHIFDHNRVGLFLNVKPFQNMRIETGYIYINRLPKNSIEFLYEHNFLVNLYFTLPHSHIHKNS
jgi:hypothetical protein